MSAITSVETRAVAKASAQEYLTFKLGAEEYGIDILKVQEIRGYEAPTRIANAPPFIKGVVNLRGVIVPIVDLRLKFNLGDASYDSFTVVIILNVIGRVVGPDQAGARVQQHARCQLHHWPGNGQERRQ